jgi:hypothetical protein
LNAGHDNQAVFADIRLSLPVDRRAYACCRGVSHFSSNGMGLPDSAGHYLDLFSAILAATLLPLGFALDAVMPRRRGRWLDS